MVEYWVNPSASQAWRAGREELSQIRNGSFLPFIPIIPLFQYSIFPDQWHRKLPLKDK
jgi:hypothetical protein